MESIALLFSKFSNEMISAQLGLLCFFGAVALYWVLARKHSRNKDEWVPAALVKEYLDRVAKDEREIRMRLFGEEARVQVSSGAATVQQVVVAGTDPAVMKELEALRAQLAVADKRTVEFDKTLAAMKAEKEALEKKLKEAPAGAAGAPAKADPAVAKELESAKKEAEELKARLAEYEVIEDDLANLKKYQIENKELRDKLSGAGVEVQPAVATEVKAAPKEAPTETVVKAAPQEAPQETVVKAAPQEAPQETVVKAAEPAPAPTETVVRAAPQEAPQETVVKAAEPAPAPEATTVKADAPAPAPEATAAPAPTAEGTAPAGDPAAAGAAPVAEMPKNSKQKEDELLSEFEKMLAS